MDDDAVKLALADIEATDDLLERALKLAGLVTTLFAERGFPLVVVGESAVEFYTEGNYMSGDIDFCRKTLKSPSPRLVQEIAERLGGRGVGRNWIVCGLYLDFLGLLESETSRSERIVETPFGKVFLLPPELCLVERVLFAEQDKECEASARQMMAAVLHDPAFDWQEARRLAASRDFDVLDRLEVMKTEVSNG